MFEYMRTPHCIVHLWKFNRVKVADVFVANFYLLFSKTSVVTGSQVDRVNGLAGIEQYSTMLQRSCADVQDGLEIFSKKLFENSRPPHSFGRIRPVAARRIFFDGTKLTAASIC